VGDGGVNVEVHPTAIVDPEARLGEGTRVGPYCVVEGPVEIGPDNEILAHSVILGRVRIGEGNRIGPHACIGTPPQSIGAFPEDTGVVIGRRNVIREFATIHRSLDPARPTRLGDGNFIMAGGHVAHDCVVGDGCVLTNGAFISGHCEIGDRVNISSPVGVHQFVRIGRLAILSAGAQVGMDVPPFMLVEGRNTVRGLNLVGMKRAGIGPEARRQIKHVFRVLYRSGLALPQALERLEAEALSPEAREIVNFCRAPSRRGIMPGARGGEEPDPSQ
jgi:UDP-N-acetylglucosamine acyltransferase